MDPEARIKCVEQFRGYRPTLDDQFDKPNQVVENQVAESGPESQISKVRLTD